MLLGFEETGSVPIVHPVGDVKKDHVLYKDYGHIRLFLPLDSLWLASHSSVGVFRGKSKIAIRGLAKVHAVDEKAVIASPLWLALAGRPVSD